MNLTEKISPLVTVFCPSYNHENYIEQALNGFLQQITNFAIEILIVDDKSIDSTVAIVEKYVGLHPEKIRAIYQQENQYSKGKGLFREFCLPQAKGKYIALCDGDDYWIDPLKLQKQVDFLEKNPEFMGCSHNTKVVYEDSTCKETLIVQNPMKDIFTIEDFSKGEIYFHTSSMVYRNDNSTKHVYEFLKKHRGDWFISLVFTQYGPIKYLDEVMSVYRIHDKGVWSLLDKKQQVLKNLKAILDFNKIFDYKYEENFLHLFTRVSSQNLKHIEALYGELSKEDALIAIKYFYRNMAEKDKVIANNDQYLKTLYSSRSWKVAKTLQRIYSLFSAKKIYCLIRKILKIAYGYITCRTLAFTLVSDIPKPMNNFETLLELKNRISTMSGATLYDDDNTIFTLPPLTEKVLDINLGIFKNVSIIGSTDALIFENNLFHRELLMMEKHHDLKRADIFKDLNREKQLILVSVLKKIKIYNDENCLYISLLKEHSVNYYHWITENMPRLILIINELEKNKILLKDKKIVILIDINMPKQCIEMIDLVMPRKYVIENIIKGEICQCSNLIYCSPFWQSQDNTTGKLRHEEFFVDKYALELIYKAIHDNFTFDSKPAYRKIYLRRKPSQMRSIINNDEVEAYMLTKGFEIVETDKISFKEQVKLFYEAEIVIGASGATFTNILFMRPQTKAIVFYPSHPSANYGVFQPLSDVANISLIHFQTIAKDLESVHSDFFVDLHRLESLLMFAV